MGYIVGLNRDRDFYQVPLALAEAGELTHFVTDYYEGKGISLPTLGHRKIEGISPSQVQESYRAFLAQMPYEVKRRIDRSTDFPTLFVERQLGKTIAQVARKHPQEDLLLYSGAAYWAFKEAASSVKKTLFVYQVAPEYLTQLINGIDELHDAGNWQQEAEALDPRMMEHHLKEAALADNFLCASTITKNSLISEGLDAQKIHVAPYGVPDIALNRGGEESNRCKFLFAGQGIARKGLHLLLEAWRQAKLTNSELTVVTSRTDPAILEFASGVENVNFVGRQEHDELLQTMARHDTFVMPSLVEGFGLVYGEALAAGCRIIGTENTGVYDMDLPAEVGTVVEAGRVQPLVDALQMHEQTYSPQRPYYEQVKAEAERLSWASFRSKIRQGVGLEG